MNKINKGFVIAFITVLSQWVHAAEQSMDQLMTSRVTSSAKQSKISPKDALMRLKAGNQRFLNQKMITRDYLAEAKQSAYGQYPWAVVLNCMDSRSVPELVFDQGLADLFTLRVAGNVLNTDILGSMEFATKVAGTRLIVVLGHTSCGAVAGACAGVQLGHLDQIIDKIKPFVGLSKQKTGLKDCNKPELINTIAKRNALNVAEEIQKKSPIIRDLIAKGEIGIVAGMHNIQSGEVTFFEEGRLLPKN